MITGAHFLIYSKDSEADRVFFDEVLQFPRVDAGGGWLIFKLPGAEAAFHPGEGSSGIVAPELYFMCDDLVAQMAALQAKNVSCEPVREERWGRATAFTLPSGGQIGLYQPLHPTAANL